MTEGVASPSTKIKLPLLEAAYYKKVASVVTKATVTDRGPKYTIAPF